MKTWVAPRSFRVVFRERVSSGVFLERIIAKVGIPQRWASWRIERPTALLAPFRRTQFLGVVVVVVLLFLLRRSTKPFKS